MNERHISIVFLLFFFFNCSNTTEKKNFMRTEYLKLYIMLIRMEKKKGKTKCIIPMGV